MLYSVLIIIDVLLAIAIVTFILLQQGKGANAGAAFGSGASATVFGARGSASFLSRTTAILATLFFVNSLSLAHIAAHKPSAHSVVDKLSSEPAMPVPVRSPAVSKPAPVQSLPLKDEAPAKPSQHSDLPK